MGITYGDHLTDIGYHDITPEQEREIEAREECARRGIDPNEICSDGGVEAWMVVDNEMQERASHQAADTSERIADTVGKRQGSPVQDDPDRHASGAGAEDLSVPEVVAIIERLTTQAEYARTHAMPYTSGLHREAAALLARMQDELSEEIARRIHAETFLGGRLAERVADVKALTEVLTAIRHTVINTPDAMSDSVWLLDRIDAAMEKAK